MQNIRLVSDLRNYAEVLKEISFDEPVFLTKNGRGRYVIVDIDEYEKTKAIIKLMGNLPKQKNPSKKTAGYLMTMSKLFLWNNDENPSCSYRVK